MTEIEARKLLAELVEKKKSMTLYELEKIGECLRHAMGTPASLGIVYIDEWISYAKAVQFVAGSPQEFLLRKLSEARTVLASGTRLSDSKQVRWSDEALLGMNRVYSIAQKLVHRKST